MKKLLILLALIIGQSSLALDLYSERAMGLFRQIQCPTCPSQTIDASGSSAALMLREEVLDLIKQGKTDEQIRDTIAEKYGANMVKDYAKPIMRVWTYSVMGIILLVFFISRRKKKPKK